MEGYGEWMIVAKKGRKPQIKKVNDSSKNNYSRSRIDILRDKSMQETMERTNKEGSHINIMQGDHAASLGLRNQKTNKREACGKVSN